jgi:hypothetical protein
MRDRAHENLVELLRRFMDEPTAKAAHEDIEAGERWLDACPAPRPEEQVLAAIRTRMVLAAQHRARFSRWIRVSLAAAAVLVLAAIGLLAPHSTSQPHRASYATLMPAAIWESDDLTADDLDLAYFSSEIRQIETQVQALDADMGDNGLSPAGGVPEELEMELIAIQTEFWKG